MVPFSGSHGTPSPQACSLFVMVWRPPPASVEALRFFLLPAVGDIIRDNLMLSPMSLTYAKY